LAIFAKNVVMIEHIKLLKRMVVNRSRYYWKRVILIDIIAGKHFYPKDGFHVSRGSKVRLGDNVYIGRCAHLSGNLKMGNDILVASYVSFVGGDHRIDYLGDTLIKDSGRADNSTTVIEDNVWIGHGCIVMSGVTVRTGSVLGAGSVLTKDMGRDEIWAGVPARFIRKRRV